MCKMKMQKTWNFIGQILNASKILEAATVEEMAAGNLEIVPNIPHMDSTLIIPTDDDNIVVDMLGRDKVLLETSPAAHKRLLELKKELDIHYGSRGSK